MFERDTQVLQPLVAIAASSYLPTAVPLSVALGVAEDLAAKLRKPWRYNFNLGHLRNFGIDPDRRVPPLAEEALDRPVPIETALGAGDMASHALKSLVGDRQPESAEPGPAVDMVVLCQSGAPDELAESIAGRLQWELQSEALPFALGQFEGAGMLGALLVAAASAAAEDKLDEVVVVTADRWTPPFPRVIEGNLFLGDAAAAVRLSRGAPAGLALVSIQAVQVPVADPGFPWNGIPAAFWQASQEMIVQMAQDAMKRHHWPGDGPKPRLIGQTIGDGLQERVARALGLLPQWATTAAAHLGASETAISLERLLEPGAVEPGERFVVWALGLSGTAAVALLEARGAGSDVMSSGMGDRHAR